MPRILNHTQLNSVVDLVSVTKAVYIMRNVQRPHVYRFGAIGIRKDTVNTAIKRLGQCVKIKNMSVKESWTYAAMAVFEPQTSCVEILNVENSLREVLPQHIDGVFDRRRDRFETETDVGSIFAEILREALQKTGIRGELV